MSGVHIVENTNTENTSISRTTASTPPPNNKELLKSVEDLTDRFKKLEYKLEDLEPLIKTSHFIGNLFGKSSNDTQENPKDAQKFTNFQEKYTKPTETTELTEKNKALTTEKDNLTKERTELTEKNQKLTAEKENLTNQLNASQK
ncbi:hypothetical protein [Helicobacter pylori]|uniref:hypothetical protein n=1 Tax=Helicobacter pylori TaxID=210 RepID=UPI0034652E99